MSSMRMSGSYGNVRRATVMNGGNMDRRQDAGNGGASAGIDVFCSHDPEMGAHSRQRGRVMKIGFLRRGVGWLRRLFRWRDPEVPGDPYAYVPVWKKPNSP